MSNASEPPKTVPERLRASAKLFEERNAAYGGNYRQMGQVMSAMYPDGVVLKTAEEFLRFMLQVHRITKETRYARNIGKGGHADSLEDMAVYAMMAAETDAEVELIEKKVAHTASDWRTQQLVGGYPPLTSPQDGVAGVKPPGYDIMAPKEPGTIVCFPDIKMCDDFVEQRDPSLRRFTCSPDPGEPLIHDYRYAPLGETYGQLKWSKNDQRWNFTWIKRPKPLEDPPEAAKSDEWRTQLHNHG